MPSLIRHKRQRKSNIRDSYDVSVRESEPIDQMQMRNKDHLFYIPCNIDMKHICLRDFT